MKSCVFLFVLASLCAASFVVFHAPSARAETDEKETLVVALTGKFPPFSFYSHEGELVGFDVDVSKKIAEYLGKDLEFVTTEWAGILAGLLVGRYDAIIGSMAITPERAERVNFTRPYYISGAQLFVHERYEGIINDISDFEGRKLGVGLGETYEHYLTENHPELDIITYRSAVDYTQDVLNKRIDGFVTDRLVGLYQIQQNQQPLIPVGPLLYQERIAIPIVKDNLHLLTNINNALERMERDGSIEAIHEKWFGEQAAQMIERDRGFRVSVIARKLGTGFGITLICAFLSLFFGFILSIPSGIILNKRKLFLYHPLRTINDFIRGTPLLVQLFFVYFGAPQIGITLSPIAAAVFTLTINCSAYMAEIIRSGLLAVNPGQQLAGRALGLSKLQVFRYIVWPQAFRVSLPPLVNSMVALMKDTALVAIISVSEVITEAQSIISVTYEPIKYYFIVALMFFVVTLPLMKLAGVLERVIEKKGYQNA